MEPGNPTRYDANLNRHELQVLHDEKLDEYNTGFPCIVRDSETGQKFYVSQDMYTCKLTYTPLDIHEQNQRIREVSALYKLYKQAYDRLTTVERSRLNLVKTTLEDFVVE